MPEDLDDVARWRSLAAEALSLAAQMSDPASKQTMLDIALGYEHIAQRAERRVNAHEFGKKRRPWMTARMGNGPSAACSFASELNWATAPS
jgi:hypothetical protein